LIVFGKLPDPSNSAGSDRIPASRHGRRTFLSLLACLFASLIFGIKKILDYSASPNEEKESNFVFPLDPLQEEPVAKSTGSVPMSFIFEQRGGFTNDASHLNKTAIYGIVKAHSEDDIRNAITFAFHNELKISSAGQQHSMGGQTFTHGGLILDLRKLDRIEIDKERKTVNVQPGVRWWKLQQVLDREALSVKSMQSINIFSIGGTLSVNAHGIDPAPGPIAPTVRSLRVMLSDGSIVVATPMQNAELFRHVLGGYGLFGVILDAELDVVDNEIYSRKTLYMDYRDFPDFYATTIEGNPNVGLFYGRLSISPNSFLRETAVHIYTRADFEGNLPPLSPPAHNTLDRFIINFSKTGSLGRWTRWTLEKYVEPHTHACISRNQAMSQKDICLVSRNEEMYDDMAYLKNRLRDTDILQEYFIPHARMATFIDGLRETVERNKANLLNVTIRIVHKDAITALPYAKENMFAFVLYFNVKFNERENESLEKTTSDLIDVARGAGGTFYLPYQLFYSKEQLRSCYPEIDDCFAVKKKYDPNGLFSNKFFEKYAA
jgi:FAD/FMN-containing dehydrogenase